MKNKKVITDEIVLCGTDNAPEIVVPEIKVSYDRATSRRFTERMTDALVVSNFIRHMYEVEQIELQEQFIVLYLSRSLNVIGYYRHTKGTMSATVVDNRIILGVALKCAASSIIISHNHPSGNLRPSEEDKIMTRKLKEAAKLLDIKVLEHIIVTKEGYYSFSEEGLMGSESIYKPAQKDESFVQSVERDLQKGTKHNKRSIEKLALSFGIKDKTEIKEFTELAIVNVARSIASGNETIEEKYEKIVGLYNNQVNLSHRTSQSILLQQYSTPAPIAYLMGLFCNLHQNHNDNFLALEPSAGNGLLTIAGNPKNIIVNEIDFLRNSNLKTQGFKEVLNKDANSLIGGHWWKYDAVLTNPPFGTLDQPVIVDTFPISDLDQIMAIRALNTMKDTGRAAVIIGGHTKWDELGRIQKGKNRVFFNYLYRNYNVVDVIQIDGKKLYTRQGTGFPTRLILIDGRKKESKGVAPLRNPLTDSVVHTFDDLYNRVIVFVNQATESNVQHTPTNNMNKSELLSRAALLKKKITGNDELGAPYMPASNACVVLNTQVPDSMGFETHAALARIKEEVGGSMDNFVRHRLGYSSHIALCEALSAEQIDAVAMAIYNIEAREQGTIIGDQTGIGKGRVAAAMIRYGVQRGLKPIFITEKANLFSDIYRDLSAIGSAHFKPFIINGREAKTDIKDEDGVVVYQALSPSEQNTIFETGVIPANYDFVVGTYSQFNSPERKPEKPNYLRKIASGNLLIMDEAHNSSGSSNTGEFMQHVVKDTVGVVFLSATFAKRPDNMPIYAMKTVISEANMTRDELVQAIIKGGVALQEILSSQLVAEGQMIRRERSFEGIEVNYLPLDAYEQEHRATADAITKILRDIISFQTNYIDKKVKELDEIAAAEGKEVDMREGTSQAGVDNQPYFSKVFNVINQMLFSIKANAVADRTIERLKEGKKPVIAFASTMGSFIEQMENESGTPVGDGDIINMDFAEVLRRGLDGIMRYTEKDVNGDSIYKSFDVAELEPEAQKEYLKILEEINHVSTGISISPIDVIIQRLEQAGYTVAEVTGRKFAVEPNAKGNKGLVTARKKITTNDAFRKFNNNEVDVLMINQSGSTGASAHAIVTPKVSKDEVRQRVMIVLQAELDINTEVQKRGRINRTGQILKPIYDYVISAIPAEKRLMMMLQKKLKSLDANTTSNQKQSNKILDVPDFLNKYGDKVVQEYLAENPAISELLGNPLSSGEDKGGDERSYSAIENAAHKVSGRVAVLSTQMQADFYAEITERYNDFVDYLKQIGEYDLEVEALDLKAESIESSVIKMGKGGESAFGEDSILEKVQANILKKPFKRFEVENLINETLDGKTAEEHKRELLDDYTNTSEQRLQRELNDIAAKYDKLIVEIPNEKKIKKIIESGNTELASVQIGIRTKELNAARALAVEQLQKSQKNKQQYLQRIFNFFTIGRKLYYPVTTFENGKENVLAISLGIKIDAKKKNPYAPSAIKVSIAIANSRKYISAPASLDAFISDVIAASYDIKTPVIDDLLNEWEQDIQQKTKDRGIRYVITGNLLQAFGSESGKLVSYTTESGSIKKGILMPEEWQPKEIAKQKVTVPILKALPLISSMSVGTSLFASGGLAFFKMPNDKYRIIVPASRAKGGAIYMDTELWPLIENGKFETASDKMQATLPEYNIVPFVEILQRKHSLSMELAHNQLINIKSGGFKSISRKKIELPPDENDSEQERVRIIKLKAKALALRLRLAA